MSKKDYHHLTYDERCQIYALNKSGINQSKIADQLKVSRSTVSREIRRNSGLKGYRYKQAHNQYLERRKKASGKKHKMYGVTVVLVEKLAWKKRKSHDSGRK